MDPCPATYLPPPPPPPRGDQAHFHCPFATDLSREWEPDISARPTVLER